MKKAQMPRSTYETPELEVEYIDLENAITGASCPSHGDIENPNPECNPDEDV